MELTNETMSRAHIARSLESLERWAREERKFAPAPENRSSVPQFVPPNPVVRMVAGDSEAALQTEMTIALAPKQTGHWARFEPTQRGQMERETRYQRDEQDADKLVDREQHRADAEQHTPASPRHAEIDPIMGHLRQCDGRDGISHLQAAKKMIDGMIAKRGGTAPLSAGPMNGLAAVCFAEPGVNVYR